MSALRATILLGLTCLAACDDDIVPPPHALPQIGCDSDEACAEGLRCAHGACVGTAVPARPITLRIVPSREGTLAPVETPNIRFVDEPVLTLRPLRVPEKATLYGEVRAGGLPVAAQITARPLGAMPAGATAFRVSSVDAGGGHQFALGVAPWWPSRQGDPVLVSYTLRIEPDPERLPPWSPWTELNPSPIPEDRSQTFEAPVDDDALLRLNGEVLVSRDHPVPLRGLTVSAVDDDRRRVSTEAQTDESGAFEIALWPGEPGETRAVTLLVERRTGASETEDRAQPVPEITEPLTLPAPPETLGLVRVFLGDVGSTFEVEGRVIGQRGEAQEPIEGVLLNLTADLGPQDQPGRRVHRTGTTTDAEGVFRAVVYPGTYVIDVVPSRPSGFRISRRQVTLDPDAPPPEFFVRPLTRVSGQVLAPDGAPLEGAEVHARLESPRYADPNLELLDMGAPDREASAKTDTAGGFSFELDPGQHALTVIPGLERGLPDQRATVEFSPDQAAAVVVGPIHVSPAAALVTTLVTADEAPVVGATVQAWWAEESADWVKVAEGQSDAAGRVTLRVPDPGP